MNSNCIYNPPPTKKGQLNQYTCVYVYAHVHAFQGLEGVKTVSSQELGHIL
jgi:hypothetical protein